MQLPYCTKLVFDKDIKKAGIYFVIDQDVSRIKRKFTEKVMLSILSFNSNSMLLGPLFEKTYHIYAIREFFYKKANNHSTLIMRVLFTDLMVKPCKTKNIDIRSFVLLFNLVHILLQPDFTANLKKFNKKYKVLDFFDYRIESSSYISISIMPKLTQDDVVITFNNMTSVNEWYTHVKETFDFRG